MPPSWVLSTGSVLKQIHETYPPQEWPGVYYPLYYLGKAIKHERLRSDGEHSNVGQIGIPIAIGLLASWFIFQNIRLLLRNVFPTGRAGTGSGVQDNNRLDEDRDESRRGRVVLGRHLETDVHSGLSLDEVQGRRDLYGRNELPRVPKWYRDLIQASTRNIFIPSMISVVLALALHDWWDFLVVGALLGSNIATTYRSFRDSHEVQAALAGDPRMMATVKRASKISDILAVELIPGDIVLVSETKVIPADLRVCEHTKEFAVDQSAITGENTHIVKHVGDMLYYTTGVVKGEATTIVVNPAPLSFVGRTVDLITGAATVRPVKTTQDKALLEYIRVAKMIASLGCATIVLITVLGLSIPKKIQPLRFLELILAITIIHFNTGRETVLYSLRASAAARLSRRVSAVIQHGIVTPESLAAVNILCTDKTGTLTSNDISMEEPICYGCSPSEMISIAGIGLDDNQYEPFEKLDPIDKAFAKALFADSEARAKSKQYKLLELTPFDPNTKMIKTLSETADGVKVLSARGAPRAILELCMKDTADFDRLAGEYKEAASVFARQGYRALGVARRLQSNDADWELLGLAPLIDQVREDAATSIKLARSLGIDVKMLTGDATVIAHATAESLDLKEPKVFFAGALREYVNEDPGLSDEKIVKEANEAFAFTEIFPDDKEAIVRFFQAQGRRVAVTGDGANDQAALLEADCGIAAYGASESAQSNSNIVFMKPGIARIVQSMQVSRQVFQQLRTYLIYRLVMAIHLTLFETLSYLIYGVLLTDMKWLIINMHVSDIVGVQLSSDHGRTPYTQLPSRWGVWRILCTVFALAVILSVGTICSVLAIPNLREDPNPILVQQIAFLSSCLTTHWLCLLILTNGRFWTHIKYWKSLGIVLAVDFIARLSHFGWSGRGRINAGDAIRIWAVGVATLCVCAVVCKLASPSELVYGKVDTYEKEEIEEIDSDDGDVTSVNM